MYPGYEQDTVPGIAGMDECTQNMNRILYLGLLKRINVLGYEEDIVPGTVVKDECIWDMNRILYLGLLKRMSISGI